MEAVNELPFLVVTGSSAGGIDALIAFLSELPEGFGAPVVIAQHLDPETVSRLPAILSTRTRLRVKTAGEREPLEAGVVYVSPPNRDVIVDDGGEETIAAAFIEARTGPKPSIDRLFSSAAQHFGDRLIAVVFSGMGSDGLAGARIVKERGGMVAVQDPATAMHPSMPLAIPPNLVDVVGTPSRLAQAIGHLVGATPVLGGRADEALMVTLLDQLRERSGVDFSQYKPPTIARRLGRLMAATGNRRLSDYLSYLQRNPEGFARLLSVFLIKVTEFFRDAELFDELRSDVLPQLIAEARTHGRELRVWSAGSSTGEEAYSLAILCAELIADGEPLPVRIFATDIDDEAVAFARRGVYDENALRHVPRAWVDKYFVRLGESYEVGKRIRNMTVFGKHDLGQRAPFPRIDLCTCRNVLIYFTRELQTRALQLFAFSLRNGGYLALGKAETAAVLAEFFEPVHSGLKIYQRVGDRIIIPPARMREPSTAADFRALHHGGQMLAGTMSARAESRGSVNEIFGAFIASSSLGVIVIDRRYDIVALNDAARTLLDIHGLGVGSDLVHLLRPSAGARLREIIDAAFLGEDAAEEVVPFGIDGQSVERWLSVIGTPFRPETYQPDAIALVLTDITASEREQRERDRSAAEQESSLREASGRIEDLTARQRSLLRANDELRASNAELQSMNEELLIAIEEASSANEEIETLNEEMQATNEELETLNEELQATVEELNTTTDEIEARGSDAERAGETRDANFNRLEREHDAASAALDALADLAANGSMCAVIDEGGKVLYASRAIAAALAAAKLDLRVDKRAVLDALEYDVDRLEPARDGQGLTVVLFLPRSGSKGTT
jgi:two-component system CheB/CheR fusion protein